jgi:uncharacterized protein HemX
MPEHFVVQEAPPDEVASAVTAPAQEPAKDEIVSQVTDDAGLVAHEAQAPTPDEIVKIAQNADGGTVGVVLALVAVLGGGAAWRFYSQHSKQRAEIEAKRAEQEHELAMRRLDLEAQTASTSPPPCLAKHAEIEARLSAVESKSASLTLPAGFDADEMSDRLDKIEKALKPKPAPRTKR